MKKNIIILFLLFSIFLFSQVIDSNQIKKELSNYLIESNENLLQNSGFEQGGENWNYNKNVYNIDQSVSHFGNQSLRFLNTDPNNYKLCAQNFPLVPGAKYSFSAYIKTKNISGKDFGAAIAIEWQDENGKWLSGSYPPGVKGTSDWTLIESNTFIPENAYSAQLLCYVRKGMTGEAWFDDVQVKRILNPKLEAYFKSPLYRGQFNSKEISNIEIQAKLMDFDLNANDLKVKASLLDNSNEIYQVKTSSINRNKLSDIEFSSNKLPTGKYKIKIDLITPNNTVIKSTQLDLINRLSEPENKVYIDKYLRTIVDGKPFFPLGMYFSSVSKNDLEIYSKSKFNCLMPYTSPTSEQMDLAQQYGLKVIYSLKDFYAGMQYSPREIQTLNDEKNYIKNVVDKIKNKKALLAWYLSDELKIDFIPRIKQHRDWVLEEDQNHPIWMVQDKINDIALYRNTFDIIGSDPYPLGSDKNISMAGDWTKLTVEQTENTKPVWMVPQVHNLSIYFKNEKDQTPSYDEIRNMAWQCICEGAKGLVFYSFFDLKRNPKVPFEIGWKNIKKVAEEIDKFSKILLSIEPLPKVTIEKNNPKWFHYVVKQQGNKTFIFSVNDGDGSGEITFSFAKKISSINLDNGIKMNFSDKSFNDKFNKFDVKIYEIVLK